MADTYDEILEKLKNSVINSEQAMERLSEIGYCPDLLNDDNGHWAISFEGYQTVALSDDPQDINTEHYILACQWKTTIKEALIYALEND